MTLETEIFAVKKRLRGVGDGIQQDQVKLAMMREQKALELMIPYSHLGCGKIFGDLAL